MVYANRFIVLIAEYTTNDGPWGDDYFLLIKSFEQGKLLNARIVSTVTGGSGPLRRPLEEDLQTTLELNLQSVAEWNSRVLWPEPIKNERLFTLDPIVPVGPWKKSRTGVLARRRAWL